MTPEAYAKLSPTEKESHNNKLLQLGKEMAELEASPDNVLLWLSAAVHAQLVHEMQSPYVVKRTIPDHIHAHREVSDKLERSIQRLLVCSLKKVLSL